MDLQDGLDSSDSGERSVAGSCEHCNGLSCSFKPNNYLPVSISIWDNIKMNMAQNRVQWLALMHAVMTFQALLEGWKIIGC
jgi:hypothetical protein